MSKLPATTQLKTTLAYLKQRFVGKDEIIDLFGIGLVARENIFLLGPPGTAKSAMVRELASLLHGKTFEYLLTRFTEPNELFGPFDIRKLREGELLTNTEGMLPEADLIFLDELLNANSAILNSLLMVLNERIFRRGRETRKLPALMIVGASNHLPEDEALNALFDRFLIRVRCDNVAPEQLSAVLDAGWAMEHPADNVPEIAASTIQTLQQELANVNLQGIRDEYLELIHKLRNAGVQVSDRRAVKIQRLVAASALLCERDHALASDLWVARYIWDTEEQREVIVEIVNSVFAKEAASNAQHPRARNNPVPNADELFLEVENIAKQWNDPDGTMANRAILKDKLRYLSGRCAWIVESTQREFVQAEVDRLWTIMM
ncbi:MAG TPA: AAA family ATPase [Haliscomenobacter sp.]|uniref:AAA family ATPase n=1 Tax=Haliscomenobacter sp. TaxID=2717303 RepID=UPI002C9CA0D2|nr:AAA family ATPase [Haliscomenobacter sp.]HOY16134.1 AAA family ATPase [Haliscomenobacter sp.]HPH20925.1 AAA family ATPase [Haliscomenobacter sp.]